MEDRSHSEEGHDSDSLADKPGRKTRDWVWSLIESSEPEAKDSDEPGRSTPYQTPSDGLPATSSVESMEHRTEPPSLDPGERFELGKQLGAGASGQVFRAQDRLLGRTVAMKIVDATIDEDQQLLARFLSEAQATGQLEHPNIVPIYEFGVLDDGRPFYTMREMRGQSLDGLLDRLSVRDQEALEEYSLIRLLDIFRQVVRAVEYAHSRSVVHRDLKPANVMLGDFGEVQVMDWGLARVLDDDDDLDSDSGGPTMGTPSYMPPEQARGDIQQVDELSDIYSLGAILYEILSLSPPYEGDGALDIVWDVVDAPLKSPSKRAPDWRAVPDVLERVCMKAMRKERAERYDSGEAMLGEINAWIEGRQPREAKRRTREAFEAADEYVELLDAIEDLESRARRLSSTVAESAPPEEKRDLWDVEEQLEEAEIASAQAFSEAVTKFNQALAHDSDHEAAREGLADLYWLRLRRAEVRQDVHDTYYFKRLLEQYDPGKYGPQLEGHSDLVVETQPDGVQAELFEFTESDRRLVPGAGFELGTTPVQMENVPLGNYLLRLVHPDRPQVTRPVHVERDEDAHVDVRIPESQDIDDGFIYVPSGEYLSGGDPEAFNPRQPEHVEVDGFVCKQFPVTFDEYLTYFNALYEAEGEAAMDRAPKLRESESFLIRYDESADAWVPDPILIEGGLRERYPKGEGYELDLPVVGIRAEDAEAYCEWLGTRRGRPYRLPTAHELEKAGRGVDGRRFPWGNAFDATFCSMRSSREPVRSQPEPVGTFEHDVSPYGIRDLAGGVHEWCQPTDRDTDHRPIKGGSWAQDQRVCHLASTMEILPDDRSSRIGFRLVYDLPG
mgnify:FL=1